MQTGLRTVIGALALAVLAGDAAAQSARIVASATVERPLAVSGVRSLDFGNVFAGVKKRVAYHAAAGAKVSLIGVADADVNFSFSLPTELISGANALPIGTWTGCHNTVDAAATCTTFTPSSSAATARLSAELGTLYVFIGATVSPNGTQVQGSYTGSITITAAYTGL
jgi:hypothetical protein